MATQGQLLRQKLSSQVSDEEEAYYKKFLGLIEKYYDKSLGYARFETIVPDSVIDKVRRDGFTVEITMSLIRTVYSVYI